VSRPQSPPNPPYHIRVAVENGDTFYALHRSGQWRKVAVVIEIPPRAGMPLRYEVVFADGTARILTPEAPVCAPKTRKGKGK
jgi:hypothetical protein